jgi:ornithine cyclodeaminase/alanine dehydrogenase-like protein (mu-crystallin family)
MNNFNINRRRFLKGTAASLALTALGASGMDIINPLKTPRVALIGTGWYGKNDLFRLIQVAPVDVVALCDVDRKQLAEAAAMVSQRLPQKREIVGDAEANALLQRPYRKHLVHPNPAAIYRFNDG